jgi:hypothetical protein
MASPDEVFIYIRAEPVESQCKPFDRLWANGANVKEPDQ